MLHQLHCQSNEDFGHPLCTVRVTQTLVTHYILQSNTDFGHPLPGTYYHLFSLAVVLQSYRECTENEQCFHFALSCTIQSSQTRDTWFIGYSAASIL
jgi:hypothetical protein